MQATVFTKTFLAILNRRSPKDLSFSPHIHREDGKQ